MIEYLLNISLQLRNRCAFIKNKIYDWKSSYYVSNTLNSLIFYCIFDIMKLCLKTVKASNNKIVTYYLAHL